MTGDAFIVKSRDEWLRQARAALDRLEADGVTVEGKATGTLDQALDDERLTPAQRARRRADVAELLQAFDALGVRVAPELLRKVGLAPVRDVLELP